MSDEELMSFLTNDEADGSDETDVTSNRPVWRVLITDDEEDVHSATTFALRNTEILGRKLEFYHAHSAGSAIQILKDVEDIAVVLLDVVMETPNAGLDMVAVIRNELKNSQARIILRTGQPNQAPEIEVIRDYDINDYKLKSELTQNKLYASLTTAIRSYQQIKTIEASKHGLDLIVGSSANLLSRKGINDFAQGVIVQLSALLNIEPEGLICVRKNCTDEGKAFIIAAAGEFCDLIDHPLSDMVESKERDMLAESILKRDNIYGTHSVVLYLGSDERGDMACFVGSSTPIREVDRTLLELFCSNISVSADNIELVDRFRSFAFTDQLVGLPNRNAFTEHLSRMVNDGEIKKSSVALIDIDNFAEINAALGQQYGDDLLKAIANRLTESFPQPSTVARVAGDTFAVLTETEKIHAAVVSNIFKTHFDVGEDTQIVSVTSAVLNLSDIEGGGVDVLKNASVVLKLAKNNNRGETLHYKAEMLENAKERLGVLRDLRYAFESGALFLVFQPKFNLAEDSISGFEALLRWRDALGNTIYPATFIEIAEQSGLIIKMGEWILKQAVEAIADIHERGWNTAHVSVNMSAAQVRHPELLPMLERVAKESKVGPNFIDLEITETIGLTDSDTVLDTLNKIKELGYSLSIDDFGTGFSSLSYLQKLPVDRLKIDQGFIHTSGEDRGQEIIQMIIHLGNTLDLKVIAEGVEQNTELNLLKKLKCDEIQGYLYARPMEVSDLHNWMLENDKKYNHL